MTWGDSAAPCSVRMNHGCPLKPLPRCTWVRSSRVVGFKRGQSVTAWLTAGPSPRCPRVVVKLMWWTVMAQKKSLISEGLIWKIVTVPKESIGLSFWGLQVYASHLRIHFAGSLENSRTGRVKSCLRGRSSPPRESRQSPTYRWGLDLWGFTCVNGLTPKSTAATWVICSKKKPGGSAQFVPNRLPPDCHE